MNTCVHCMHMRSVMGAREGTKVAMTTKRRYIVVIKMFLFAQFPVSLPHTLFLHYTAEDGGDAGPIASHSQLSSTPQTDVSRHFTLPLHKS